MTSLWSRVSSSSETKLLAHPDPSYKTQLLGMTGASSESSDEEVSQLTYTSRFLIGTRVPSTHLYVSCVLFHLCLGSAWVLIVCLLILWLSSPPMSVWEDAICKLLACLLVAPLVHSKFNYFSRYSSRYDACDTGKSGIHRYPEA